MIIATGTPLRALAQDLLEFGVVVVADPGFLVWRNIRRRHFEWRLIPTQPAGKRLIANVTGRSFWRMAVAASENAVDQIIAALDQIGVGPRVAECDDRCQDECRCDTKQSCPPLVPHCNYTCA